MKQLLQSYKTGELYLAEVPVNAPEPGHLLVRTACSLISVGTEKYMLELARMSLMGKAAARPDLVRQVIFKAKAEGITEAIRQALGRLDTPVPLGYSAAGTVIQVGQGCAGFADGDRVACAGSGYASHAEFLRVPRTLAVRIPEKVSFEAASFVALGGIAMHAVRCARLTFGERAVVLGLGLLGQLAVQILRAAGYGVFGVDVVPGKVKLARAHGAHDGAVIGQSDVSSAVRSFTAGRGADAVIVFASARGNEPIELAAELARERGHIVAPGLVGLDLPRKLFYEKELDLVVSRAWGPGMYDPEYEAGERDYPPGIVRWTAQRNMEHFLDMLADGKVDVEHLITHRFDIEQALAAYEMFMGGKEPAIGVILHYPGTASGERTVWLQGPTSIIQSPNSKSEGEKSEPEVSTESEGKDRAPRDPVRIGVIGAGLFASTTLLPALSHSRGVQLRAVSTATGVRGEHIARKYGMMYCTTDNAALVQDPDVDLVMVLTRHGLHAELVCQALEAGKHVFVEKPLALNEDQLQRIIRAYRGHPGQLMVGFNRRFAPATRFLGERFGACGPLMIQVRVNVGFIPPEVWVHHPEQGGGNIIGEVCHFVDLAQTLTGSQPVCVATHAVRSESQTVIAEDNVVITLSMADGSIANIVYTAMGDKGYERERVEVFGGGAVGVIENFKTAIWSSRGKRRQMGNALHSVDRGHRAEMQELISALRAGKGFPVPFESYVEATRATFAAVESLHRGLPVSLIPQLLVRDQQSPA